MFPNAMEKENKMHGIIRDSRMYGAMPSMSWLEAWCMANWMLSLFKMNAPIMRVRQAMAMFTGRLILKRTANVLKKEDIWVNIVMSRWWLVIGDW